MEALREIDAEMSNDDVIFNQRRSFAIGFFANADRQENAKNSEMIKVRGKLSLNAKIKPHDLTVRLKILNSLCELLCGGNNISAVTEKSESANDSEMVHYGKETCIDQ
jgi:hypothetical protein